MQCNAKLLLIITLLPRFLLRSLAVSTLSDLTLYQSSSGEEEAHIPDVHSSISGLLMDISNRFVITCGDKVARVFHNVAGYKGQLIRSSIALIFACLCIFHMIWRSNTIFIHAIQDVLIICTNRHNNGKQREDHQQPSGEIGRRETAKGNRGSARETRQNPLIVYSSGRIEYWRIGARR